MSSSVPGDLLPSSLTKNLSERSYEKRKLGALELEHIIKEKLEKQDHESIGLILDSLRIDFVESSNPNHRKGGLIGLAASAIALHESSISYLEAVLTPVLTLLSDKDPRVRYYACEALYNVTKVARGHVLGKFNDIFQALCLLHADSDKDVSNGAQLLDRLIKDVVTESEDFEIERFIPLLRRSIALDNPFVRQLVVGWITVLNSVPDIQMLEFLPDFLGGLFDMLSDEWVDIRQQADSTLAEFLEEIREEPSPGTVSVPLGPLVAILVEQCQSLSKPPICRVTALKWLLEFITIDSEAVHSPGDLVPFYSEIVGAVQVCISDEEGKISVKAEETNKVLLKVFATKSETFFSHADLVHRLLSSLLVHLQSSPTRTRLSVLTWIAMLMDSSCSSMKRFFELVLPPLLDTLSDSDDSVIQLDISVLSKISASSPEEFDSVLKSVIELFCSNRLLLDKRGVLIIRQLCVLLGAERIFRSISLLLLDHPDLEFASLMVQTLDLILLTSAELFDLRECIKNSLRESVGQDLFVSIFKSWCHNPVATLSLCLLAQAYELGSALVFEFANVPVSVPFLVQLDKLVQLIESPIFVHLRLQLLEPSKHPFLLQVLYGLLMLLPQSSAFNALRIRLQSVSTLGLMQNLPESKYNRLTSPNEKALDISSLLSHFQSLQVSKNSR